jgi:hypothetical protein
MIVKDGQGNERVFTRVMELRKRDDLRTLE